MGETMRVCEVAGMDCAIKCPGCIISDGGQWDGKKWTYPEDRQPEVKRKAQARAAADCLEFGHPDTGSPSCVLCGAQRPT